ncbi:MAG: hypothetical protein VB106_05085 [Clostridiaceae bacterium]|nr:hypothetical protein [Clostridiaceae bacterium]
MSCGFDREIIQKYADNTIDPLEFIFLKEHINYCGECRKELDMVMTLESELEKLFDDDSEVRDLDIMITRLVDDCMRELNKREKLKYVLNRSVKIGRGIMGNSLKFAGFIPGSRYIGNGVKRTASFAGDHVKAFVKKEAKKLLNGLR